MTLVTRPDLSTRTALSKSEVATRTYCTVQSFYSRTQPRPWKASPDMTFGSAADAGVELVLKFVRSAQPVDWSKVQAATAEVILRDDTEVNHDDVMTAVERFHRDVVPEHDWSAVALQVSLSADFGPPIGMVNGHPDIVTDDCWDAKTSKRAKTVEDIWSKPELPIYAALMDRLGSRPQNVGYFTWARTKSPSWGTVSLPVDDDMIEFGTRELRRQANLRRQFDMFRDVDPCDWFEGPAWVSKCVECSYADICTTGQRNVRRLGATDAATNER